MNKIGLALGGGGAKGFAHIPVLEVFDKLGVKPACITGTSIGSIVGALYASGLSAKDIADLIIVPPRIFQRTPPQSHAHYADVGIRPILFSPHLITYAVFSD